MQKKDFNDILNYYTSHGCKLLISKKEYVGVDTKMNFICVCGNLHSNTFSNFKAGNRCKSCALKKISKNRKLSHNYVFNYYKDNYYIMKNMYNGLKKKDQLICPNGHEIEMTFDNFKHDYRCGICFRENNFGENHSNYNINRNEILLNRRLRQTRPKSWYIKHMKQDLNYENFLKNPDNYTADHIIPIKLFCELFSKFDLKESVVRKIINKKENIQLLTWEDNWKKHIKGSSIIDAQYYLINNGILKEIFFK